MRVLIINTIAGSTSTGYICDSIAEALVKSGNVVYMASGYGVSNVKGVKSIKIGHKTGRILHALMTRITDSHGAFSTRATNNLISTIQRIKPDIVHIHNLHGYYINSHNILSFLKTTSINVVITMHDCWLVTGHCYNPLYVNCDKYKDYSCDNCPQKLTYPAAYIDKSNRNINRKAETFSNFNYLHLVAVSNWIKSIVNESFLHKYPLDVIYNGIDIDTFHINPSIVKKRMILGVANVWNETKGFNAFLDLRRLLPNAIEIVLVGVSNDQFDIIPRGVTAYGFLSYPELSNLYNEATITVSLSQGESFGMTVAESNACGTPVFAYENTALKELISDETGMLIPDGNLQAMADAIINYDGRFSPNKCRMHVLEKFNSREMANNYIKLFRRLLGLSE